MPLRTGRKIPCSVTEARPGLDGGDELGRFDRCSKKTSLWRRRVEQPAIGHKCSDHPLLACAAGDWGEGLPIAGRVQILETERAMMMVMIIAMTQIPMIMMYIGFRP